MQRGAGGFDPLFVPGSVRPPAQSYRRPDTALAARGGVVQICLYEYFLARGKEPSVDDIVAHIDHVVQLVGVDYVGIGSDFDGGGGIPGCEAADELINITKALLRRGYTPEMLEKIWGGNFLRVMQRSAGSGNNIVLKSVNI